MPPKTHRTEGDLWHERYPGYTKENISYMGVARCIHDNGESCIVHEGHPAVSMLKDYSQILGTSLESLPTVEDGSSGEKWFEIPTSLLETIARSIVELVLDKVDPGTE